MVSTGNRGRVAMDNIKYPLTPFYMGKQAFNDGFSSLYSLLVCAKVE
jgi:hypothetical protein